jgi:EpsI family protein
MTFLKSRYAQVATAILVLQAVAFYAVVSRAETAPPMMPLATFPTDVSGWKMVREYQLDKETEDVLKADDTLNRAYVSPDEKASAILFIAFFKTQRYGQAPHSPKNCLPGNGFEPIESGQIEVAVPGRAQPLRINRYLTARGDERSVTLYWYQSHDRVIAEEFAAKIWLIADSIRYHRSDTSLVKVVVPVRNNDGELATKQALDFVKVLFAPIRLQLPM